MQFRTLLFASALVVSGTLVGVAAQQVASADVSEGDRPVLVPIDPCRLVDTRPTMPIGAATSLTVDALDASSKCAGAIPPAASALALNVTAVGATSNTFVTIWAGGERPEASSLNPGPGQRPAPNAVTTELGSAGTFEIYNNRGSVDVFVDVVGYYEPHNHDDRYDTSGAVDTKIAAAIAETPGETRGGPDAYGVVLANGFLATGDGVASVTRSSKGIYRISLEGDGFSSLNDLSDVNARCRGVIATSAGGGDDVLVFMNVGDADTFVDCDFSFTVWRN